MPGLAVIATDSYGADTNAKVTAAGLQKLRAATWWGHQFSFLVRYVSRGAPARGDISADEVGLILDAGFSLLLVQHVRLPGWTPSLDLGASDGSAAAANAQAVGYVPTAHIALDLEGVAAGTPASVVTAYANAWGSAVIAAGYQVMLYVGYDAILTPEQLFGLPGFHRYWSDSGPRSVAVRGFCMKQLAGTTTLPQVPFQIDPDRLTADNLGDRPIWMAPGS